MNGLEFVASVIGSLAWPAVVVTAISLFEQQIRSLIGRLTSAKAPGGWEAEFERRAGEALEDAQAAAKDIPELGRTDQRTAPSPEPEPITVPPDEDPTFSVIASWERVGAAVSSLAIAADFRVRTAYHPGALVLSKSLLEAGVVNTNFVASVRELQLLRDLVAHGRRQLSVAEAEAYVDAANELIRACSAIIDFKYFGPAETLDTVAG
ncbi:hypothetical protein [Cellulomonas hominis]